mgnify:FL=1
MANYTEKPKKDKKSASSKDIALSKLDFYDAPKKPAKCPDKIKGRPKSPMQRFAAAVFPQKDDPAGEKARKLILIAAVIIFAATIVFLVRQLLAMNNGAATNDKLAEIAGSPTGTIDVDLNRDPFATNGTTGTNGEVTDETEEINVTPVTNTPLNIDFNALKAINSDTRAWIKITGTPINNVVVSSGDNSYYLDHDFYGNDSITGTIYSDKKNKWDGTDDNIILYGHNMISGEFFATLGHYAPNDVSREPIAFYKVHPTVMLATPDGGSQTYKIFAAMLLNTQSKYGEVFKYTSKTRFSSKEDFNNYIIEVMDRSWFFTDVDLDYGDQLLTLSTCYWPLGESVDTRWVVFARKVRPGESEFVDTTVAVRNYQAKLFDYYYDLIGGQWYGSVWDKSKLLSYGG